MLDTTTQSRISFERTTQAIEAVADYLVSRRPSTIERAGAAIEEALRADENYAIAVFYRGIIHDLGGTPADAVPFFEKILAGCDDASLLRKANFNLGVAYYHQYSHRWLSKAAQYFEDIASEDGDDRLKALAHAHLAQVHAMWMRPSASQDPQTQETQDHIKLHFGKSKEQSDFVERYSVKGTHEWAVAFNAKGAAHMYITDWLPMSKEDKRTYLESARSFLQIASKSLANDWAITCNLASASLRFGVLSRAEHRIEDADQAFEDARQKLELVVNSLRPEYGFALFELGILHRAWGKFEEARVFLERSKNIPEKYRDISDASVEKEFAAASQKKTDYPIS